MNRRLALVIGSFVLASTVGAEIAEAGRRGRVRFGGGGVRVTASAGARVHWASRPRAWSPTRWSVSGRVHVRPYYPRYRYYRPYTHYYGSTYIPSYYGSSYYPVAPQPAPAVAAVAAPQPALPKLGLGLFAGGVSVEGMNESSDYGVLGRLRLGNGGLLLEGELGKTSYEGDLRIDRRLGASLIYEIGARNRLAPYVLAGFGVQEADVASTYTTTQGFGEIGVGLRYAISPQFHLTADVRAGSRDTMSDDVHVRPATGSAARVLPPPSGDDAYDGESYTRARLSALFYF